MGIHVKIASSVIALSIFCLMYSSCRQQGTESSKHRRIGIQMSPIPRHSIAQYKINPMCGVYVQSILPGSTAENSGIVRGDIIYLIDETRVDSFRSFNESMESKEMVRLKIFRDGKKLTLTVKTMPADNFTPASSDDDKKEMEYRQRDYNDCPFKEDLILLE
jgi:S1-C subfamily serine protease